MFHSRWFALFSCLVAALLLGLPDAVYAHVGSGGNCAACHGSDQPNASQILASKAFQNPNPRKDTGASDTAPLPVFEVVAGETVDLKELVKATGDEYGVALVGRITDPANRYGTISLVSGNVSGSLNDAGNKLVFTTDSAWVTKPSSGTNPKWYTQGAFAGAATDQTFTYRMAVGASTPPDYYPLTFATAGGAEDWSDMQSFYLCVLAPVPEPSTIALLGFAAVGLIVWRRGKRTA
ncbi:MAG: PEP-CTERM sorting domain-containing protein [Pirellulales bacterium]|nr:PEP-CTERM sorting domain-containing protein [Pirellulales bacterium]